MFQSNEAETEKQLQKKINFLNQHFTFFLFATAIASYILMEYVCSVLFGNYSKTSTKQFSIFIF